MKEYDVVVIGGGPGGYVAAVRASQLGLKVALIEKEHLGGTCVNWGCIPTKALLKNAEVVHLLSQGRTYGFECPNYSLDYSRAQKRSRQVAKRQGKRVEALLKSRNVEIYYGNARLTTEKEIEILATGEQIFGKNIIIATGSTPRQIPGIEFDGVKVISSREALQLSEAPSSVIIVGAGPIGMEFATIWNHYGTEVTVLEMMPDILPTEDEEVSKEAKIHFQNAGIKIRNEVRVESVAKTPAGVEVLISTGDTKECLSADMVLMAIGFSPNSVNLGLEKLGVKTNRGYLEIDEQMRTSIDNIYAIGDINGKLGLAHVASAQAIVAADAIAGRQTQKLVYKNIPRCVFGYIEVASVGLTEKQAKDQGYDVITKKSPFVPNGKALAISENHGFVKLVADAESKKLLGSHMIGPNVTELIAGPAGMISIGATIDQIGEIIYAHPTLSEAVVEGVHALAGHAIHL